MNKLDILKRDEFVSQLISLVENISENKANTCFAINGAWGCGKSFVLDMFEEQLGMIQSEHTYTDKYFIIRYNCWKYDYYEEPLVAIVATIISEIEEKTKLFPDSEEKSKILGMLKATGVALLSMANASVKEKTGMDILAAVKPVVSGEKAGAAEYEKVHDYDAYFGFKKVLGELAQILQSLAEEYTVVFLVDELDRCMPEYAVKVLERLHHLTEESTNTITIVAIDKVQLCASVKQIFGFESPEKYLEKFISFEVKLDLGTLSENFTEKYADYCALFDKDIFQFIESLEECVQGIFTGIDIRTQEHLINKAKIAHKLLYNDKKDYSFMCMELLIAVMICVYKDDSLFTDSPISANKLQNLFVLSGGKQPAFGEFFSSKFEGVSFKERVTNYQNPISYSMPDYASIYAAIAFTWYWMHKANNRIIFKYTQGDLYSNIANNYETLKKYAETLRIIG